MAKNTSTKGQSPKTNSIHRETKSGVFTCVSVSNTGHKLNVPAEKSQMSKSDRATVKAWKYSYANREKRVD